MTVSVARTPALSRFLPAIPRFHADEAEPLLAFFREYGFALMHGLYDEDALAELDRDMAAQHYVCHISEVSKPARAAVWQPELVGMIRTELGADAWLLDDDRFGVVFQDARPGPTSAYSRIGWHSDEQSGPHLCCPAAISATLPESRWDSSGSRARSRYTPNAAT